MLPRPSCLVFAALPLFSGAGVLRLDGNMAASSDSELWAIELDAQGESQQLDPRDGRVEAKDTSFLTDASCCETKGKDKEENAIYCCRKQENGNADGGGALQLKLYVRKRRRTRTLCV